jgi:hypothetical protein
LHSFLPFVEYMCGALLLKQVFCHSPTCCLSLVFLVAFGDDVDPRAGNPPVVFVSDSDTPHLYVLRSFRGKPLCAFDLQAATSTRFERKKIRRSTPSGPFGRPSRIPADSELFHQLIERRPADAKFQGGGSDPAFVTPQGVLHHLPFHTFPRFLQRLRR